MACLGLPLPEGGIKIWSQASFHMPTNPAEVPKAIGPTFGTIKAKPLQNNPLDFFRNINKTFIFHTTMVLGFLPYTQF